MLNCVPGLSVHVRWLKVCFALFDFYRKNSEIYAKEHKTAPARWWYITWLFLEEVRQNELRSVRMIRIFW